MTSEKFDTINVGTKYMHENLAWPSDVFFEQKANVGYEQENVVLSREELLAIRVNAQNAN